MSSVSRGLRITTSVFAMTFGLSFAASADDFVKECKIGNPGAESDKVCNCMSAKVTGADRPDAIEAMNKTNIAMAKGAAADAASMTPKVMKGIETVMTAQVTCM
jgi:hypothetical protein